KYNYLYHCRYCYSFILTCTLCVCIITQGVDGKKVFLRGHFIYDAFKRRSCSDSSCCQITTYDKYDVGNCCTGCYWSMGNSCGTNVLSPDYSGSVGRSIQNRWCE